MQISDLGKYFRTLKYLKPKQVFYQIKYRVINPKPLRNYFEKINSYNKLSFSFVFDKEIVVLENQNAISFSFLNLKYTFNKNIDWNFQEYGKLWNYNLQYFDFLNQSNLDPSIKNDLLNSCYSSLWVGKLLLEPYPASLRIMNVIRFLSTNMDANSNIASYLKAEVKFLTQRLEYHILANHLLENAFAIHMAGYFFGEIHWQNIGKNILKEELKEQILEDGAHYELSPMYHQIILFRVLELLDYFPQKDGFYFFILEIAQRMLIWLDNMTFNNGDIPHFNDSTYGIAFSSSELNEFAGNIGISLLKTIPLNRSGYRKFQNTNCELVIDVNGISPSYQPGHAHADTFTYCLNYKNKPVVVDTGISSYNLSTRRDYERSTEAHNTIVINGCNSAEVWAGFRVGKRLKVVILKDENVELKAVHNGYVKFGILVQRQIKFSDNRILILDTLEGKGNLKINAKSYIHFHPSVKIVESTKNTFIVNNELQIQIDATGEVKIENYSYCIGFNKYERAKRIVISMMQGSFTSTITFMT
ncbi:MAG: heparinase II/III domain-containing protein [Cecembia sp.]